MWFMMIKIYNFCINIVAFKIVFDRLSQSKDFSENDLDALTTIENSLNKNIEFKQTNIKDYFWKDYFIKDEKRLFYYIKFY